jgi:hypothetical protein
MNNAKLKDRLEPAWLALQAAAIVASILLAFAIDAWWEARQERETERTTLVSLQRDFVATRKQLDRVQRSYDVWRDHFARFQDSTAFELEALDLETAGAMTTSLSPGMTFNPTLAVLDALVNEGRLGVIEDPTLRDGLAQWLSALDDIAENETDIRSGSLRVQIGFESHGGPYNVPVPGMASHFLSAFQTPTGVTLSTLRQDSELVGRVRSHHYQIGFYQRELVELSDILDANLATLARLIGDGKG